MFTYIYGMYNTLERERGQGDSVCIISDACTYIYGMYNTLKRERERGQGDSVCIISNACMR